MKKTNVFFIICDELRADTLGFMGDKTVKTPNIDILARDSAVFENCYCSSPMCAPSRASLATGRHTLAHGVLDNGLSPAEGEVSLYELLRRDGFKTVNIGKWHVNKKAEDFGMDVNIQHVQCRDNCVTAFGIMDKELRKRTKYKKMDGIISLAIWGARPIPEEETIDTLIVDEYIKQIEMVNKESKPVFMRLSVVDPHSPYLPCEPYASMYTYEDIKLPPNFNADLTNKPLAHRAFYKLRGHDRLAEEDYKKCKASYYGLISCVDSRIGRVINELKRQNLYDDSMIIFTSDHGAMMGEHGFIEKWGYMYEPVVRIPFMIKFPEGEFAGNRYSTFVENIDTLPTILDFLGIKVPDFVHGKSILPYLYGETAIHKNEVYSTSYCGGFQTRPALMIRDGKWKMTVYPGQERIEKALFKDHYLVNSDFFDSDMVDGELYDMENDPYEMDNLFNNSGYSDIKRMYENKLVDWENSFSDRVSYERDVPENPSFIFRAIQGDNLDDIVKSLQGHKWIRSFRRINEC